MSDRKVTKGMIDYKEVRHDVLDADHPDLVETHVEDTNKREVPEAVRIQVLSEEEQKGFKPMIWPMMDNGKEKMKNAVGYPTGGWYKEQQDLIYKRRQEKAAAEEAARAEQERHVREALEKEKEEEELTVAKVEDVIKQAHEEGYNKGFEKGHKEGYAKGDKKGQKEGYEAGYAKGNEKGYNDGLLKGHEEGFAQGQQEGLDNAEELVTTQVNRFRRIADMLANPMRQVDRDVTDELVYLVSRLAKVVIKHDVQYDPKFLAESIEHAISVLPNYQKGATIHLNQDDLSLVTSLVGADYIAQQHWDLQPDNSLANGDLIVTNDISSVEWKLDDRIDQLLDTFLKESAPAVDSALREHMDGFPEHDETPKPLLAPKPKLQSEAAKAVEQQEQEEADKANDPALIKKQQEQEAKEEQDKRIQNASEKRKFFKESKEKYGPQAVEALRAERKARKEAAAKAAEEGTGSAEEAEVAAALSGEQEQAPDLTDTQVNGEAIAGGEDAREQSLEGMTVEEALAQEGGKPEEGEAAEQAEDDAAAGAEEAAGADEDDILASVHAEGEAGEQAAGDADDILAGAQAEEAPKEEAAADDGGVDIDSILNDAQAASGEEPKDEAAANIDDILADAQQAEAPKEESAAPPPGDIDIDQILKDQA